MEVTRKNFNEKLPLIKESIEKADFLVIDTEFTGLMNGRDVSVFDSPSEYYHRLYTGASDFLLIQYGICAFHWNEEKNQYINDAYNFYLFPRKPGPDKVFLCQNSSLDFLASQGFDFNKLIKEGISYMTETTETRLRKMITEKQKNSPIEKDIINIPEQFKQQIEDICERVRKFLDDKNSEEMEIDRCNNFMRRLLFQELAKFKHEAFVETKILENQNRVLKVTRIKAGDNTRSKEDQRKEKQWEDFENAVGFTKVARMISQSGKLVIGHNMLLDVLHTLSHFFQPLPDDYQSFKEFAHCMFPKLLDTKYMSSLPPFKDKINSSVLQHLLTTLAEEPFSLPQIESEPGRGYSQTAEKHHEAGYDAYVTGLCFLSMYAHLTRMRGEHSNRLRDPACPVLKPFLNKLFLARTAHQDSPYMNLAGTERTPSRDHIFFLTFPMEWSRNEINQLFSPFGAVTVQFIDDISAIVALSRRDQARDVLRAVSKNSLVTLVPYATHNSRLAGKIQPDPRRQMSPLKYAPTPDARTRTGNPPNVASSSPRPVSPEKSTRARSNSGSTLTPPPTSRKRTSSGVFQVDEAEPPPKKPEVVRSNSEELRKKAELISNGKASVDADENKDSRRENTREKETESLVIETFDSKAKGKTVAAFKESDSWD